MSVTVPTVPPSTALLTTWLVVGPLNTITCVYTSSCSQVCSNQGNQVITLYPNGGHNYNQQCKNWLDNKMRFGITFITTEIAPHHFVLLIRTSSL